MQRTFVHDVTPNLIMQLTHAYIVSARSYYRYRASTKIFLLWIFRMSNSHFEKVFIGMTLCHVNISSVHSILINFMAAVDYKIMFYSENFQIYSMNFIHLLYIHVHTSRRHLVPEWMPWRLDQRLPSRGKALPTDRQSCSKTETSRSSQSSSRWRGETAT